MAATLDRPAPAPRQPLSDALARRLSACRISYDAGPLRVRGFGLRISSSGQKTFVLNYTLAGRERRIKIGDFPTWSTQQARKLAAEFRRLVDMGRDPLGERNTERKAPTFGALLDHYLVDAKGRKRSWRGDAAIITQFLRPRWGGHKVSAITRPDVRTLHREITRSGRPIRANRVLACASAIFSHAVEAELIATNPCREIRRNPENKRTRHLSQDELSRLWKVLRDWPDQVAAAAVRLLMHTGARRGELLKARWTEFDLSAGVWIKPAANTKAKREHRVPLSREAIAELQHLPRHNSFDYLFPNARNGRHWTKIRAWPAIRAAAGLDGVRLHDGRHTAASLLVSTGNFSLPVIGNLLGHSQPSTTARYAHLMDGAVRNAVAQLGQALVAGDRVPAVPG